MPTEAQRRANQKQDAARKRVALWLDEDGPEHKALKRIMREQRLPSLIAALRHLLDGKRAG